MNHNTLAFKLLYPANNYILSLLPYGFKKCVQFDLFHHYSFRFIQITQHFSNTAFLILSDLDIFINSFVLTLDPLASFVFPLGPLANQVKNQNHVYHLSSPFLFKYFH